MIASKVNKICNGKFLNFIRPAHKLSSVSESELQALPKQDPQVTQISSGLNVVSVENYSPITSVSVVIKAGARHEGSHNLGITHCLRNCSVNSTQNASSFNLTRSLELIGAKIGVTTSRENIIYSLQVQRDNFEQGLEILADVIQNPTFKPWEVSDVTSKHRLDRALFKTQPDAILLESVHEAAFRGGLSNSLFMKKFMIGKHTTDMLSEYVNHYYTFSRSSVIGLGVSHGDLEKNVNGLFTNLSGFAAPESVSKFVAGEVRHEVGIPHVHTAVVAEGAGLSNLKDVLSLGVLQCMLGLGTHFNLSDSSFSKLGAAGAKVTSNPFSVSTININYSDTGLFGFHLVGEPNDMKQLVKAIVAEMRSLPKCVNDNTVKDAKHRLKAKLLLERDTLDGLLYSIIPEVSQFGKMRDAQELEKAIDDLKTADVSAIAAKVLKAKPAMASVGRLHSTPFLDELL